MRNLFQLLLALWLTILGNVVASAQTQMQAQTESPLVASSLTLTQCVDLAVQQNPVVRKAREELRRTHGVIVETRAQAIPNVRATGSYTEIDQNFIDTFPGAPATFGNQQRPWAAGVQVTQLLFSGGRVQAALRAARLSDQVAVLGFDKAVADTIFDVRQTFYEILLSAELIGVREQSVKLLEQQLADVKHRLEAGTVPQFNVLRAEVELANAQPPLIRAQNALRLAKEKLVKLLALDQPGQTHDFTTMQFVGQLEYAPREWALAEALRTALASRPEALQAEKQMALQKENVTVARSGYYPELTAFAGYGIQDSLFANDAGNTIHGWSVGGQASWNIFDGLQTKGRIEQARAQFSQSEIDWEDTRRGVELDVRQAYSDYQAAVQLVAAEQKTVEQGEESLRLAEARFRAGTGTQLDVLSAQEALTEARSNKVLALYDFNVAVAKLDHATGLTVRHQD